MGRKTFFAGVALATLIPAAAFALPPALPMLLRSTVAVRPPPPPPPPPSGITPPAQAQAAGFKTLAANYDFTGQSSDGVHPANWYQTIGNWLTCVNGYNAQQMAWQTVQGPGNSQYPPCARFNIVNDGGKTALDITYTSADYTNGDAGQRDNQMQNCDNQSTNCSVTFPMQMYYEVIDKVTQATVDDFPSSFTLLSDDWSWPANNNGNEYDFIETYSNFGTTTAGPDGVISDMDWGTVPATTYTTYGYLITSNGTNDISVCLYENDSLVQCKDEGDKGSYGQRNGLILQTGPNGTNNPTPTNPMDHLIQRVRVWTCSGWANGYCYGSSQFNDGSTIYWH